jgi:predicted dithiol-disulfide oxidoreductase (DUF899 family)
MTATETRHNVVSRDEWLKARLAHLAAEKEFTRKRDELSRQRRELPWVRVEKSYVFEGPYGPDTLADLFAGRSQLIVYHFMLGPNWEEGCKCCSFLADHFDAARIHLAHRDVTFAAVSRAPMPRIQAFQNRMAWRFHWVSAFDSDFQRDYGVHFTKEELAGEIDYNYHKIRFGSEEAPGLSVFYKDEAGEIFHTYSTYARPRFTDRNLSLPRFRSQRPRRRGLGVHHGVGPASRPLRRRLRAQSCGNLREAARNGRMLQ